MTINEAPDDVAAAKVALAIGSAGNVTTETLRAFTDDEYRQIVASLPSSTTCAPKRLRRDRRTARRVAVRVAATDCLVEVAQSIAS